MDLIAKLEKLQLTFNKRYQSRYKIGQTATAKVFLGVDPQDDDKQISIKVQKTNPDNKLEHQAKIYKIMQNCVGFPTLYWFGREHDYDVLITDLLGPSLEHLFVYCEEKFSLKTVIMIADQLLDRLESMHDRQFVYRDIKPANFLVGLGAKADKIYIIDFELSRRYVDLEGTHKRLKETPGVVYGNQLFLSIHGHLGLEQSRRDDLESLGYMLVYFLKGYLPWQNLIAEDASKRNLMVKEKKVSIPIEILCENLPKQFQKYFEYVKALQFEEEPDYVWLKRLFKDLSVQAGQKLNLIFDWAEKHHLEKE